MGDSEEDPHYIMGGSFKKKPPKGGAPAEPSAEAKKQQRQLQLNTFAATQEDEKKNKTEILINNNAERKQRMEEALKHDLSTQEESWKQRLAQRKRNNSVNRSGLTSVASAAKLVGATRSPPSDAEGLVVRVVHALGQADPLQAQLQRPVRYLF